MYIVAELDGSVFNRPIAAFHVIPYFMWTMISLPPLDNLLDISQTQLHEMKDSYIADPDEDEDKAEPLPDD